MVITEHRPGSERRSDGLWIHHGSLNIGPPPATPRLPGDLTVNRGSNRGAVYLGSTGNAYLFYDGTKFQLAGGQLQVDAGLVPGTVISQLGSYRAVAGYTVPAANAWYESNAQVTVTTTGGRIRASASGSIIGPSAGQVVYLGFGTDFAGGNPTYDSLTAGHIPAANYTLPFAYTCYSTPAAGSHRFSICVYSNGAGGGLWGGVYTNLWIHEEKA